MFILWLQNIFILVLKPIFIPMKFKFAQNLVLFYQTHLSKKLVYLKYQYFKHC